MRFPRLSTRNVNPVNLTPANLTLANLTLANLAGCVSRVALVAAVGFVVSGCDEKQGRLSNYRAIQPIPSNTLALMSQKGTDAHQPILIRAFKKEAELEIWKMRADGQYVHLKTFPMCRWSGQLGPKRREGDRQVPEGFYTITQGQLNPNSAYYLSFNVGYPNAYDKAHGFTGGSIMVHGDCSSAGCFSMTDDQISEIYAITREAFGGGQRAIQMQSLPFRMNAENLAKHRFDPNIRFWKQLKEGVDQFEVSKRETKVAICDKRYVFGATPADGASRLDANSQCPVMNEDADIKTAVLAKQRHDETQIADLVAKGVKAVKVVYADGGQHPSFTDTVTMLSRPEAVAKGPTEIAINEKGNPLPAVVQVASVKADAVSPAKPAVIAAAPAVSAAPKAKAEVPVVQTTSIAKAQPSAGEKPVNAAAFAPTPAPAATASADKPFYKRWLGLGQNEAQPETAAAPVEAPAAAAPAKVPVPPRKQAQMPGVKPQASLATQHPVAGAVPTIPSQFKAYAPVDR